MLCPYCLQHVHIDEDTPDALQVASKGEECNVYGATCPSCEGILIIFSSDKDDWEGRIIYPRKSSRKPVPPEVPVQYAEDLSEACLVLDDSPKASAALSRRALQRLLHEHLHIKGRSLAEEIQTLLDSGKLPTFIAEAVDAVRNIGNLAAHPLKNEHTGEIVDVEPGEAEWLIEVLEMLLDFYFVQPERQRQKKAALNAKLTALGKPPMK